MKKLTHDIKFPEGIGKYDVWIFAICIFCLNMPYFMWQVSIKPFLIICAFLSIKNLVKGNKPFFGIFMMILYLYMGIFSKWSFFGILFLMLLTTIFFAKPKFLKQTFDVYIYIFSIMLIPSILQHICVNMIGIDMPHTVIKGLNTGKMGVYSQYLFMVNYSGGEISIDTILPRFYSYFDEPGVVGTIAAVILCIRRFNLKSWANIPIFIAGLLSFSLFFYLITLLYVFIIVKLKYKLLLLPVLLLLFIFFSDNEVLNFHIFGRLNLDSNLIESFMNRRNASDFDSWYSYFSKTPEYLTGMGAGYSLVVNEGGCSYKNIITDFGIIFFVIYLLLFVLYGVHSLGFSRELLIALLIMFGVIYQRPFIQDLSCIFLIFAPFVFLQEEKRASLLPISCEG